MPFRRFAPIAILLTLCAAPGVLNAQDAAPQGGGRGRLAACRTDARTFCQNVEAGRGRRLACLVENKDKLSPDCATALDARGQNGSKSGAAAVEGTAIPTQGTPIQPRPAQVTPAQVTPAQGSPPLAANAENRRGGRMAACRTDAATFCANAAKGGGERLKCLKENQSKLAPDCQAAIAQVGSQMRNFRQACKADREALCSNVQKGSGGIVQCLKSNRDKLSPACGEALSSVPEKGGKGRRADAQPQR